METFIFHFILRWPLLGYSLVFIGVIFEGDLFLITTAFLTRLEYFELFNIFLVVLVGTYAGDLLWYWLGRLGKRWDNKFARYMVRLSKKVEIDFTRNLFRTLLITKFAYGTHHLTLVKAAIEDVPFWKYVENILPATLIWVIIVGSLGYVFASSYLAVRHYFKFVELGLLAALVLYFVLFKEISKAVSSKKPRGGRE